MKNENKIKEGDYVICDKGDGNTNCNGCGHEVVHKCIKEGSCFVIGCSDQPECGCKKATFQEIAIWRLTK